MNHTTLLNLIADKYRFKTYLEIGVQDPRNNFERINCAKKTGVDPVAMSPKIWEGTSDAFFEQNTKLFDLVFIDGLHHADQVKKDFDNSLEVLNEYGFIVIHDCLPKDEVTSLVPRESKMWHGDVYKFIMTLCQYDGIEFTTYDFDNGCCVVRRKAGKSGVQSDVELTWESYLANGKKIMNISNGPINI